MEIIETGGGDDELPKTFKASLKSLHFGFTLNLIFLLNGLLCLIEIGLQLMFTAISRNVIYFAACVLFGPLQLLGVLLLFFINFFTNRNTRFKMGVWATRLFTIAFIPFVNTVALNTIYVMSCQNWDGVERTSEDPDEVNEFKYCGYVAYNAAILVLSISCVILNLIFCIPFNVN